MHAPRDLPLMAADMLARIRARRPRVHCITNSVAQNFTANMLLAAGAIPSMTIDPAEIGEFVAPADALLVNLGTFDAVRQAAIKAALEEAVGRMPWVLDPVFVDRSLPRAAFALELAARPPRRCGSMTRNSPRWPGAAGARDARALCARARHRGGAHRRHRYRDRRHAHGVDRQRRPLMAKVTAMGCAASALVAACLAVEPDAWLRPRRGCSCSGLRASSRPPARTGPGSSRSASSMRCTGSTSEPSSSARG